MRKEHIGYILGACIFLGGIPTYSFLHRSLENSKLKKEREQMYISDNNPIRKETIISKIDSNGLPTKVNINWYDSKSNLVGKTHYDLPSKRGNELAKEVLR